MTGRRTGAARLAAGLAVAAALGIAACEGGAPGGGGDPEGAAAAEAALAPDTAPRYEARTLEGDPVSLGELKGEVVLLNVWATWCAPCRKEVPELQALHEAHGDDGLRVIGVTVDDRSAGAEIRRFIDEFGMTYDIWWDPDQAAVTAFEAMGVPLTVLIDEDGRIAWRHLGAFQRGDPELLAAVEDALDAGAAEAPAARGT
jgi:thiol-disulfide isomerase/thioredoxin